MILLKCIRNRHFHALLKLPLPNSSNYLKNSLQNLDLSTSLFSSNSDEFLLFPPSFWRPLSLSAHFKPKESEFPEENCLKSKKALSVFFKESIGVLEKTEFSGNEAESDGESAELMEKLKFLEEEVRSLKKKNENGEGETLTVNSEKGDETLRKGVKRSLWAVFADKKTKKEMKLVEPIDLGNEDPRIHKKLSSDMQIFAHHLFKEGYLNDGNFMSKTMFDLTKLENSYAREFLKFAAVKFGRERQEITKWLSASDLKELALFGCPSMGQKTVLAAKRLRSFFEIEEHKVCQKCTLRKSCKLENQIVGEGAGGLRLSDVTRVLVMYAMESVPPKLLVPEKIEKCVSRILKEVINLSQTVF